MCKVPGKVLGHTVALRCGGASCYKLHFLHLSYIMFVHRRFVISGPL